MKLCQPDFRSVIYTRLGIMMSQFIQQIPHGPAGESVRRAISQIDKTGIACEKPAVIDGSRLKIGFGGHHTNELILGMLAGLVDPDQAEQAQDSVWRLPALVDSVSSLDTNQKDALCAFARSDLRPTLYEAISTLIQAEALQDYFEYEQDPELEPKWQHYTIRPSGHAAFHHALETDDEERPTWDVLDELRKRAQAERMSEGRRVALVTILGIYNGLDTKTRFKGRGWTLRAGALGRYLRDRIAHQPVTFDAFVHALAVYPGW